jgi:hypothetical protein
MNEVKQIKTIETRLRELAEKRLEILSMPPEKARDAILESPQPAALVHSIREEDFYFLIHDIGVEDSLELLGLASARQWEFLLDLGIWEKDRISLAAWTRWLNLLLKADPSRLVRWISEEQIEEIEYYLYKNIQLAVREHDQDPSDFGEGFYTHDDILYVRFNDALYDLEKNADAKAERDAFLEEFLRRLAADDHIVYHNVLVESQAVIPAEYEEEAYRLRNIRMDEKGFKPFDEAIGIYQPLSADGLDYGRRKFASGTPQPDGMPAPYYPFSMLEADNLFARSLARLGPGEDSTPLQAEFAGLCNRVISADRQIIREQEGLKPVVKKVCGYVSIGLGALTGQHSLPTDQAASLIRHYLLEDIFRVGYGKALDLKWRAEKWRKESWAEHNGFPLSFWGEAWLGVIGGLLIRRPLFFDNYQTGVLYREFYSMTDIAASEKVLEQVIALDELLGLMDDFPFQPPPGRLVTWKSLMLTLWARHATGYEGSRLALPLEVFRPFYGELWEGRLPSRRISDAAKERFLAWLAHATRLEAYALSRKFRETLEELFDTVENEYQAVSEAHLDPRHIHLFMLS